MKRYLKDFLALDSDWQPELPSEWWRFDVLLALAYLIFASLEYESTRSIQIFRSLTTDVPAPELVSRPVEYAVIVACSLIFVFRRRFPISSMLILVTVLWTISGNFSLLAVLLVSSQALFFISIYSGLAWARNRKHIWLATCVMLAVVVVWVVWSLSVALASEKFLTHDVGNNLSPLVSVTVWTFLVNYMFFFGAIVIGQNAWARSRDQHYMRLQAEQIEAQSAQLAAQAVLAERLRISQELHDVVAHHVSLIGIQAAAARVVAPHDLEQANQALEQVEESSRQAVKEMRALLHTLRTEDGGPDRAPTPSLAGLDDLIADSQVGGVTAHLQVVGEEFLDEVPLSISTALYRTIQESLANVRTHSTAKEARVVVRLSAHHAEAEITDSGRFVPSTAGSGYGLVGIRERVAALGGSHEIGPRPDGGWRVRVSFGFGDMGTQEQSA